MNIKPEFLWQHTFVLDPVYEAEAQEFARCAAQRMGFEVESTIQGDKLVLLVRADNRNALLDFGKLLIPALSLLGATEP